MFDVLDDYHKKLHIIHAYAIILDAVISRRGAVNKDMETVRLLIDPNKVAKVICKLMKVDFLCFEELQKEAYTINAKAFPFPNPKGTYFKTNDEIRSGITKFQISDFYLENGTVMVKAQSINHFDGGARTITLPEIEMMQYYRIVNPACVNADFIQKLCQINDGKYPDRVFLVGADTDCCVLTIATSLFEYNIRPIVLTYYCDSNGGSDSHKAGITCLKRLIGENQLYENELYEKSEIENI